MKFKRIISTFIAAVVILSTLPINLYADFGYQQNIASKAADLQYNSWKVGYEWKHVSEYYADTNTKYSGDYSIRIQNTGYNDACVEKTFIVEPNTKYRFSAMVKYSGFKTNSADNDIAGASIGESFTCSHSEYVRENKWTKLEYEFDSGNKREIKLCLRNGMFSGTCSGTAWFSDIKLEKNTSEPSNKWNFLVVIFKNVSTPVTYDGNSLFYSESFDDTDISRLAMSLNTLYTSFESISGGRMKVNKIDIVTSDSVLTSLAPYDRNGYCLDPYDEQVSKVLDYYLSQGTYNQIIAISPIRSISGGWAGLGGTSYKGIGFCQVCYNHEGYDLYDNGTFPDAVYVHETLHCLESASRGIDPNNTAVLHDNLVYGYDDIGDGWRAWYTAYMRSELTGGKGLNPSVYMVYNNKRYVLVSDDMAVGSGINAEITLGCTSITINKGVSLQIGSGGANLKWTTSDSKKVKVSNGIITGKSKGKATIKVKDTKTGLSQSCTVTVINSSKPIKNISAYQSTISMKRGESLNLKNYLIYTSNTTDMLNWYSSDTNIINVKNGKIYANRQGSAVITVIASSGSFVEISVNVK